MKLPLVSRISIAFGALMLGLAAVCAFAVIELRRSQTELRLVSDGYLTMSQALAALESFQANQTADLRRARETENAETRRAMISLQRLYAPKLIEDKLATAAEIVGRLKQFAPESEMPFIEELGASLNDLRRHSVEFESAVDQLQASWSRDDAQSAASALFTLTALDGVITSSVRHLHGSIEARIQERVRRINEGTRKTEAALVALPLIAILVGILATTLTARALRPLHTLFAGVSRIRDGDFETKFAVPGDGELAALANEFDAMARALKLREGQLKEKQAELLEAERLAAVGRVSAQVAHEVRNPLSSIGLNVELLSEHLASATFPNSDDGKEAAALVAAVTREVDRVTEITEEYLRLARLPAPTLRQENIVEILDDVLSVVSGELARASVKIQTTFPPTPLTIIADEAQLRQVFLNLIRNAREAMGSGGTLLVAAWSKQAGVEIHFQDTGPGIAPENQDRVFEPFFTTKKGGTGLGLPLSRQIVEAHGGALRIVSDAGGSARVTFVVSLPREG